MTKPPEWGYRADGQPRKFGDLTREEQRSVTAGAVRKLQAEFDDPNSVTSRACKAILHGPDVPRTCN